MNELKPYKFVFADGHSETILMRDTPHKVERECWVLTAKICENFGESINRIVTELEGEPVSTKTRRVFVRTVVYVEDPFV